MRSIQLLFLCIFISTKASAGLYVYGLLQASSQYIENGSSSGNKHSKYEHDFESNPYGAGAEWRFAKDSDFSLGVGASYQSTLKVEQNTTSLDASSYTSRDDLQHMSFTHAYFNTYSHVNEQIRFILGLQYSIPEWRSHGRFDKYRIRSGLGYRAGLDLSLPLKIIAQMYYRHIILGTEDTNGYEGELNISSLMLSLGWVFW